PQCTAGTSDCTAIQPALTRRIQHTGSMAHIATRHADAICRAVSMRGNTRPRRPSQPATTCVTRVPAR
ncbi:hypothetical protein, partial [Xanthomonas sontii]|uniref:hypothetical protein n=1 Tax=Xanthomonas sontii TaxID=2650745 RepID=UPI001CC4EA2A